MTDNETLDTFLGSDERCATFHDASLISVLIDYQGRELVSEWELCVGDPDAPAPAERERLRRGRLRFTGLHFWVVDPPETGLEGSTPWLTSDGPLSAAGTQTSKTLTGLLPPGSSGWYLFFSDWNAFAYCGAEGGEFEWL